jgi:glycosyltransferase involved in cell wall biosynthesis
LSDIKPESELLYALYQQADIFMMSSIHEPFGIVVLEAWASGLPVISSFVGGLKNLIKDGETGLFTDYSNPNAIKESIEKLNNQPSLYRDIVKKSAITVAEQYSWSTVYQQTRDIYLQQIQRKKV